MGYLFRARISSFFAGAATASLGGFYLLYKDYMLAREAVSQQVKEIYDNFDECCEALNRRITALENVNEVEPAKHKETSE